MTMSDSHLLPYFHPPCHMNKTRSRIDCSHITSHRTSDSWHHHAPDLKQHTKQPYARAPITRSSPRQLQCASSRAKKTLHQHEHRILHQHRHQRPRQTPASRISRAGRQQFTKHEACEQSDYQTSEEQRARARIMHVLFAISYVSWFEGQMQGCLGCLACTHIGACRDAVSNKS